MKKFSNFKGRATFYDLRIARGEKKFKIYLVVKFFKCLLIFKDLN